MSCPFVIWRKVTVLPLFALTAPEKLMLSAIRVRLPPLVAVVNEPAASKVVIPMLPLPPVPAVPVICTAPPPDVIFALPNPAKTPKWRPAVPVPPVPVTVRGLVAPPAEIFPPLYTETPTLRSVAPPPTPIPVTCTAPLLEVIKLPAPSERIP